MNSGKRQEGTTYGNARMHRILICLLKNIDIRIFYIFMHLFVIPITLILSPGARLTYHYFRKRRGYGKIQSGVATYRNHCIFGQTVIDKFAMYAGRKFPITFHGLKLYQEKEQQPESLLLLNAHIGCSEIIGYSLQQTKPCNVLVFGGEKQSLMNYRQASFGNMNIKMIPVGTETSHSDDIINALERGETISVFADRFMNKHKIITSTIYGNKVNLARGPFSLAVNRGVQVMMVSAMKEKNGSYTAFLTPLHYDQSLPKGQQRQQLADAYTAEIERLLNQYPHQWFNYSNLWSDEEDTNA